MPDGRRVDSKLIPLGVPSRMSIGQVLVLPVGMAARALGVLFATAEFDGATEEDVWSAVEEAGMDRDAKPIL